MHRTRRSRFWKVIDVSEPDWLLHLQKTWAKILRQSRWTMVDDFSTSGGMGTNAFFTFTICLGRGLPYEAAFAAVFVAGCIFILLSITGLRTLMIRLFPEGVKESILPMMRETHGKARFFLKLFEVAEISFQRFQRFKLLTDRSSGDQPGSQGIGAGVGLYLCFIAFQSSEGTFFNNFNRCTWGFLRTWTEWTHHRLTRWSSLGDPKVSKFCDTLHTSAYCSCLKLFEAEGMGLSVADPATLVTLNSLSPSNYDSAKSLGLTPSMSVLGNNENQLLSEYLWIILNPYCQDLPGNFAVPGCSDKSPGFKAVAQHCSALRHCYAAWPHSWWTSTGGWFWQFTDLSLPIDS